MSDAPAQRNVSLADMNGRIAELEAQRDGALTRCAKIAGEKAEAVELVQILKAEVDRLTGLLNDRGGAAPAATSEEPGAPPAPAGAAVAAH